MAAIALLTFAVAHLVPLPQQQLELYRRSSPEAAPDSPDTVSRLTQLWKEGQLRVANDATEISAAASCEVPPHTRALVAGELCATSNSSINSLFLSQQIIFRGEHTSALRLVDTQRVKQQQEMLACQQGSRSTQVAICTVVHNEAFQMLEWLQWHRLIGIGHFYIYNDQSSDNLEQLLLPFTEAGVVTLHNVVANDPDQAGPQAQAFAQCMQEHGKKHTWIGFMDADEYLVLHQEQCLHEFLHDFEPFPALHMSWLMFGPSGYFTISSQHAAHSTLFEKSGFGPGQVDSHCKSFCHTGLIDMEQPWTSPHKCPLRKDQPSVNELGKPVLDFTGRVDAGTESFSKIHVAHFWMQSLEQYVLKKLRGRGFASARDGAHDFDLHAAVTEWERSLLIGASGECDWKELLQKKDKELKQLAWPAEGKLSHI